MHNLLCLDYLTEGLRLLRQHARSNVVVQGGEASLQVYHADRYPLAVDEVTERRLQGVGWTHDETTGGWRCSTDPTVHKPPGC